MKLLQVLLSIIICAPLALRAETKARVEKVGGTYELKSIEKKAGHFTLTFVSTKPSGRFDNLIMESDHLHMGLEQGRVLRLSAQVIREQKDYAEVSQMLIFLPNGQSHSPVWLLSNKDRGQDLGAAKYLEMHDPQSDYRIL